MSARLRSLAVSAAVVVLERVDIDIQCGLRGSVSLLVVGGLQPSDSFFCPQSSVAVISPNL